MLANKLASYQSSNEAGTQVRRLVSGKANMQPDNLALQLADKLSILPESKSAC
jgi:hypothetical protein